MDDLDKIMGEVFGEPPRVAGSDTSSAAADSIASSAGTLRAKVFQFIQKQFGEGATDEEIELQLGIRGNTVRPRRRELAQRGMVEDSGQRRLTKSGRKATVWVAVLQDQWGEKAEGARLDSLRASIRARILRLSVRDLEKVLEFIRDDLEEKPIDTSTLYKELSME